MQSGASRARFPVAVVMERITVSQGQWSVADWRAIAVVAGELLSAGEAQTEPVPMREGDGRYLCRGLSIELFKDASESYWHNLMSRSPTLCVICQRGEGPELVPITVTADYDEASAHMEGDDAVFAVPMPPEIYQWVEHFVVENLRPLEKKGRKRKHWTDEQVERERQRPPHGRRIH